MKFIYAHMYFLIQGSGGRSGQGSGHNKVDSSVCRHTRYPHLWVVLHACTCVHVISLDMNVLIVIFHIIYTSIYILHVHVNINWFMRFYMFYAHKLGHRLDLIFYICFKCYIYMFYGLNNFFNDL